MSGPFTSEEGRPRRVTCVLSDLPDAAEDEVFETLAASKVARIERIVSRGQRTPDGVWLKEDVHEWVVVLRGCAQLRFRQPEETLDLETGDALTIPAGCEHRVEMTAADSPTIWLAVHFAP